ncbi:toxin-antitoxin system YwqK family antitoxin [Hymenobacter cavernae]|uniref:Toxin-antitoxin system YwqK family antitoxin n=1 Tax=Hymenobacter cavernae TaxID=2044852 RepID=A0ABQ1TUL6_9BACT|nr:hypothetical protein [Hymenobacter cavernae]GGF03742.1 hypothetical protein GCM10011383_13480 [Hymenobacter cavernae]
MRYRLVLLGFILISWATSGQAQQRKASPAAAVANIRDCYRIAGKDSIAFFYSTTYLLTPAGCAAIRRHVRFDSTRVFKGFVRDYWMHNNLLALSGAYRGGKKEGVFELYHRTGELAARGHYHEGRQVGDWAYWYPSGKPRQVLSFGAGGEPMVQQFWNEAGQQLVRAGNGTWYRDEDEMRWGGTVVNGIPDGRWRLQRLTGKKDLVASEKYSKGHFRNGIDIGTGEIYLDQSRISLNDWEDYSTAESFKLGPPCPPVAAPKQE